ncbi:pyridoxamine 5'-phosphate oxidase [Massilia sp. WF1]|uniref:pyridoxamine 5'-phosphate oxidase n=1 Tax=unclassified Massilia TaxID=2609279 RepID=UPI00064B35DD|nr:MULTISPECIES: pyridoxamine 5'-phosphate oxidase [unclassified Massilia]ALK99008.1 pyridoxamine 5'-phosphate oxidase [Massilia sp. WG5]KLU38444.1 pyridoxamine 5'-phosphate oxidase [Massilia sp. WF1]
MNELLPDPAPDFDQPVAVLKHCHGRIRKQLATLEKLLAHLPRHGADEQARQAAGAVLKYFEKAAHLHHEDEEQNLIPMLRAVAQGEDAATLQALAPVILQDHKDMDAMWQDLHEQLSMIADGSGTQLSSGTVQRFSQRYLGHMEREESTLAPMALRLFGPQQMAQLAQAMQQRRGIVPAAAAAPAPAPAAAVAVGERVADLRKDYGQASLDERDVADDPIRQFTRWFEEALKAEVNEPNAMGVSTVDERGRPSSRIVLVKQFDDRGFTWYTNYDSQKGTQLNANPFAALLFFWSELERQVRIEGRVERTSAEESDKYFNSRPLKSRLSAIASHQSAPIVSRAALEHNYEDVARQFGETPQRPPNWGGFRLVPERIEFWQGRRSRFHDRIVYTRQEDGSWTRQRLQP